jgi:hypothetical protein
LVSAATGVALWLLPRYAPMFFARVGHRVVDAVHEQHAVVARAQRRRGMRSPRRPKEAFSVLARRT